MSEPTFENEKIIHLESGGVGGGLGGLINQKYDVRCDTAPYMCDKENKCAHPCC